MGLWLKQDDGSLVPVGGGGSAGGGEVLTGDPFDPPADWAVGQLLYDGVEDTGGGSEPHDHDDYLPLTGGTLTGDLQVNENLRVDGIIHAVGTKDNERDASANVHINASGYLYKTTVGSLPLTGGTLTGNLQVDGALYVSGNWSGGWVYNTGTSNREFMIIGDGASGGQIQIYGNNDSNRPGKVSITGDLLVNGIGVSRFGIAEGIDTADVLDRAETATMPAPADDDGVATTDADVESLSVNEVVTALLAKVKELSAEIEELKGA